MSIRAHARIGANANARRTTGESPKKLSAMRVLLTIALLLIIPTIVAAQNQTRERRSVEPTQSNAADSDAVRNRVVGPKVSNHADKPRVKSTPNTENQSTTTWGNASVIVRPNQSEKTPTAPPQKTIASVQDPQPKKLVQPTSLISDVNARAASVSRPLNVAKSNLPASATYNVGIGDVLDVRLANWPTRESTLFTVMKDGTLEYPLAAGPVAVAGLTTDEIANLLRGQIKVIDSAQVTVSVRDFASHAVVVSGLVDSPGRKALRREAMPLYTVLAQALVRPEATVTTITRNGKESDPIDLKDNQSMARLVVAGDVIKVGMASSSSKQFLYVGGDVASPGEKSFRDGMTLTQALLAAGGGTRTNKTTVKVSRRNSQGFLSTTEYNLRTIEDGKAADPLVQAGDRIEVVKSM